MKKRILTLALALCLCLVLLPVSAQAATLTGYNVTDKYNNGSVTVYDAVTGEAVPFRYTVPKNGATVLIFYSTQCGYSMSFFDRMNATTWTDNPYVNLVCVADNYNATADSVAMFMEDWAPATADNYTSYIGSQLLWKYFHQISSANSIYYPVVLVMTESGGTYTIRYGDHTVQDVSALYNSLCACSPAFAQYEEEQASKPEPEPTVTPTGYTHSGNLGVTKPTQAQLRAKWNQVTSSNTIFKTTPSAQAPYTTGSLTDEYLKTGLTYLNYVRYAATLPSVQLSASLNENAQYGAVVLAAIDQLTHYPYQPDDMSDDFYEQGYAATTSSNISARWGYDPRECLIGAVSGCMTDNSSLNNLTTMGHRRWLLNPKLLNVGFGYAQNPDSDWSYIVNKIFDDSGSSISYEFVSWPASGNFPTNLFDTATPWSVSLNPSKYQKPDLNRVKVTITRKSDGKTWSFSSATGQPVNDRGASAYMNVENSGYGINNCIIFNPGSNNVDEWIGLHDVVITGIKNRDGSDAALAYQVNFFSIDGCATHSWDAGTVTKKAMCYEAGVKTYTCTACGETKTESIPSIGHHDWDGGSVTTAPTCGSEGVKTYTCAVCWGKKTEPVPATGSHTWNSGSITTAPTCGKGGVKTYTCTVCGGKKTESVPATGKHTWNSGTVTTAPTCVKEGVKTFACTVCGGSKTESVPATGVHIWDDGALTGAPGCTEKGELTYKCTLCDAARTEDIPETGHSWGPGTVTAEPTCVKEGVKTYTCTACGDTRTEPVPVTGYHAWGDDEVGVPPTCTKDGEMHTACEWCGFVDVHIIPAVGYHVWDGGTVANAPTCGSEGIEIYICTACGEKRIEDIPATGEHTWDNGVVTTAPTYDKEGVRTYTCADCSETRTETIPATGEHTWDDGTVTAAPTCTQEGVKTYTCTTCGETKTQPIPATGKHLWDEGAQTVAPTCGSNGVRCYTCATCGETRDESIPATGEHSWDTTVTIAPTCTAEGEMTYACAVCGDIRTKPIPATGEHTWDTIVTTPAACTVDGEMTHTCTVCGATRTEPIPATGHDYVVSGSVAPGCETLGYTVYDCGNCGGSKMDDYIPKLGHDFKNGICSRCSAKEKAIFVDVPAGQYFFDAVKWAAAGGITTGTDETHFSPFLETERCQIVTFLWRAYGKPEPTLTENPFVDVKESDYFYKAVLWAVEKGITTGTDETHFSPFAKCERGQVVTFLWRAEGKPEPTSTDNPFEDVKESHYFYKAVLWAVENGITSGADQTHFSPFAITQRCQAVTFLYRALNKN